MKTELSYKHEAYTIREFDEKTCYINYDRKLFPNGFDTVDIHYKNERVQGVFLSKGSYPERCPSQCITDWSEMEKIVQFIKEIKRRASEDCPFFV